MYEALHSIKRSAPYRALRPRFAGPKPPMPSESWVEGELLYYVFDLIADDEGAIPPMALFIVERERRQLLLVRLVTPNVASTEVEVQTIYQLEGVDHGGDT